MPRHARLADRASLGSNGRVNDRSGILVQYLRQLQRHGVTRIRLDEGAREVLRVRYRAGRARPPGQSAAPAPPPAPAETIMEPDPGAGAPSGQLAALREQARHWPPVRALGSLRETMVFATGNPEADLMLVGEAPGYEEERRQQPFVGQAGRKLDRILAAMGLDRDKVYISNICKFRPAMRNQTTNNRKPTPAEMQACLPFIRAEIGIVRPKCIVALGATAAEGLLDRSDPVGRLRGSWHEFEGIPVRVTYHPSYLLHNEAALGEKRKVWDDMLEVMKLLGMPITEKQQRFFGGTQA